MKTVLIAGASGMIGGLILQEALKSEEVARVYVLNRSSIGRKHEKLREVLHSDFLSFEGIEAVFSHIDVAYFCIGVYTGVVSKEQFRSITVDYTKAFVNKLLKHSPKAKFTFLSGMGADRSEQSRVMFARDKGAAENFLLCQDFSGVAIFRPAYIYPVSPRREPNLSYRLYRKLYPLLKLLWPNGVVTSEHLAKSMFVKGLSVEKVVTYENKTINLINPY